MAWLLFILVMIASFVVQMVLSSRIDKYTQVATNVTGAQIARMMLEENGINDVSVRLFQDFSALRYVIITENLDRGEIAGLEEEALQ